MPSHDELSSRFHEMRARMAPDEAVIERLAAALNAASGDDQPLAPLEAGASAPSPDGRDTTPPPDARDTAPLPDGRDTTASTASDSAPPRVPTTVWSAPSRHRRGRTGTGRTPTGPTAARPPAGPRSRGRARVGLASGGLLGSALAVALVVATIATGGLPHHSVPVAVAPVTRPAPAVAPPAKVDRPAVMAGSYAEVYAAVTAAKSPSVGWAEPARGAALPAPGAVVDTTADGTAFSPTNVQVLGIDEDDIVKTDGSHLYIAKERTVAVVAASGVGTTQVASIDVSGLATGNEITTGPVAGLMIEGTTLVVLTHGYEADATGWRTPSATSLTLDASRLKAAFYDISDPSQPRYAGQVEQSGSYVDSRLSDGVLYLVSAYHVSPDGIRPADPATFAPSVAVDGSDRVVEPGDIYLPPAASGPTYSLVSAIDVGRRAVLGEQAVLGSTTTVYMSPTHLFLVAAQWPRATPWARPAPGVVLDDTTTTEPSPAAGVTPGAAPGGVVDANGATTDIVSIGLASGAVSVAAQGSVPGVIVDQFALDERDGYLRLATTWSDRANDRFQQNSALWVLDPALAVVGSIPTLAANESVQSVRFDGPVGYVVTFRTMDPLFTVDLSDPTAPTVQGALKIPGFSQYLHPFGGGLLLGVGVEADAQTGRPSGLKLSMFDVDDPYAVKEIATAPVAGDSTPVASDHKAAYVDADLGLVGFVTTSWTKTAEPDSQGYYDSTVTAVYHVERWTGSQFQELAAIPLDPASTGPAEDGSTVRGVRIGDSFYVIAASGVGVFTTDGYARLADLALA